MAYHSDVRFQIRGQVTASGIGLAGETVRLFENKKTLVATTTTDADGFYGFQDKALGVGTYDVVVDNTSLAPVHNVVTISSSETETDEHVVVKVSNFAVAAIATKTISGTVTAVVGGLAVPNAVVVVGGVGYAVTAADGTYSVTVRQSETYYLLVYAALYVDQSTTKAVATSNVTQDFALVLA